MIRAFSLLGIVALLMWAARSYTGDPSPADAESATATAEYVGAAGALAFGFLLLAAIQTGNIFSALKLPRLTGYIVIGFVCGQYVLGFLTKPMVESLKLVNGVAIGIIALSAGAELNFRRLRSRVRAIALTTVVSLIVAVVGIAVVMMAASPLIPFFKDMTIGERAVVALTLGVTFAALSPTVILALIDEAGAAGPISDTSLGIVVVNNLMIVLAFAGVKALADATFGASGGGFLQIAFQIFGSIIAGLAVGLALLFYVKMINRGIALFVVAVCFLCAEVGQRLELFGLVLHVDPMIICLTAGMFLENVTDIGGKKLIQEIQPGAMPVFAVFFAVVGAELDWPKLQGAIPIAITLAAARGLALYVGGMFGMKLGGVAPEERKHLHFCLYSQSGIAISLAILLENHFNAPGREWGKGAAPALFGGIILNEIVGPVLFKAALAKSGEAGKREAVAGGH